MFKKIKYMILAALMLVVLSACSSNKTIEEENSKLEVSSTFSIPVTFEEEGKKGEYILVLPVLVPMQRGDAEVIEFIPFEPE